MRFPAFYLNCYRYIFQFLILTITPIWLSLSISTPNPIFNLKNLSLFGDPQNVPITVSPQNMSSLVSYTRTHTHNEVSWSRISRYYLVFHYFSLKAKTSRSQTGTDTLAVVTVGIERFNAFFFYTNISFILKHVSNICRSRRCVQLGNIFSVRHKHEASVDVYHSSVNVFTVLSSIRSHGQDNILNNNNKYRKYI